MSKCKDCNEVEATNGPRCICCHRKWRRITMQRRREAIKRKELAEDNHKLIPKGWQRCRICLSKKRLSEYRTSMSRRQGKLQKICDSCLTRIQVNRSKRQGIGFTDVIWRQKAYSTNKCALSRMSRAQQRHIALKDMPWVCKPQDLAKKYVEQNGICYYCVHVLTPKTTNVEHTTPLSRDGKHECSNLRLTCPDCNQLKLTKTEIEFLIFARDYAERLLTRVTELLDKEPAG